MVDAEQQGIDELSRIPVTVTFEDRQGTKTTLVYELNVTAFGNVSRVVLDLLGEA